MIDIYLEHLYQATITEQPSIIVNLVSNFIVDAGIGNSGFLS
jgi:hypothetical protein